MTRHGEKKQPVEKRAEMLTTEKINVCVNVLLTNSHLSEILPPQARDTPRTCQTITSSWQPRTEKRIKKEAHDVVSVVHSITAVIAKIPTMQKHQQPTHEHNIR